jgi:NADH-quinone oxidoreductase subunit N
MKNTLKVSNLVLLQFFTVFPEYFISASIIYLLIVTVLVTYHVYGLMIQKAVSECIALILLMACYLILNDDLITLVGFSDLNNSIANDYFAFFTKIIVSLSSAVYFLIIANSLKEQRLTSFEYLLLTLFSVLGLLLLCSSNDLLTAYLAIELASLSSYVLAAFRKTSAYSVEGGIKYFITGAVSSAFFLLGSSFLYGILGSIGLLEIYELFNTFDYVNRFPLPFYYYLTDYISLDELIDFINYLRHFDSIIFDASFDFSFVEIGLSLIVFSLFIKLALAPFHLWSLDVYEGAPTSTTFFFAVISKLSIFVFLVRLCHMIFYNSLLCWSYYSLLVGVLSIFVGAFGGLKQRKVKTLLAYSSTSHMGYTLVAFSMNNNFFAIQMVFFYLIIYIIAGLATWSIILFLRLKTKTLRKKYNKELGELALLSKSNSALAFSFAITMFSIAGIPPLLGFLAKMGIFLTIINKSFYFVALIVVLFSVVSTFYYIRIVKVIYFENILVGQLYYPITSSKTLLLSLFIFLLIFWFVNPTLLHLFTYKLILHLR